MFGPLQHSVVSTILAATLVSAGGAGAQEPSEPRATRFLAIENIQGFAGFFNVGQGAVRIVVLGSPTCSHCSAVRGELKRILGVIPSKRLRAYIVFAPAREGDSLELAFERAADLTDRRVAYFWDPNLAAAKPLRTAAGDAGDHGLCMVFDTDAVLRDAFDPARLWVHHGEETGASAFDGRAVETSVRGLLAAFDKREREAQRGAN